MPPGDPSGRRRRAPQGPVRRVVSSGGLVVRPGDEGAEVAMIRNRTLRGSDVWTFPKGAVEEGETAEQAALREVREETGLEAEIVDVLPDLSYWFSHDGIRYRKTVHLFLMRATGGDTALHDEEVEEVRFFRLGQATGVASFASEKRILEQAADLVSRW